MEECKDLMKEIERTMKNKSVMEIVLKLDRI
jgi:hypothetical protein